MIDLAYELTIKAINEPSLDYAGAIMKRWYEQGVRTPGEAEAANVQSKPIKIAGKEKKAAEAKSYDVDEFLIASMKRSYKEK